MYFSKSLIFVVLCTVASPIYIKGWPSNIEISCRTKGYTSPNELMLYPSKTSRGKDSSNNLKSPHLLENQKCYATINAPIDSGIMVSIENFDLRPNDTDKLSLTYKPNARSVTLQTKWYSNMASVQWKERNKDVIYSAGNVKVYFETGNKRFGDDNNSYEGFELVYTVVRDSTFMLGCTRTEFPCRNKRCISKELRCDGYNHCGDRSAQEDCDFYIKPISLGWKIGIGVVGTVFFLIAIALGIYLLIRRRQSNVTTTTIYGGYPHGQF